MKYAIVFTSVSECEKLLRCYVENIIEFNHSDDVEIIFVGDKKTPRKAEHWAKLSSCKGVHCEYWGPDRQKKWLEDYPHLDKITRWNSDVRRNIGYVLAYQHDANVIISIDDDNYAISREDFLSSHELGEKALITRIYDSGWFNPCFYLKFNHDVDIYQRGFIFSKRDGCGWQNSNDRGRIVVNQGLWLHKPDVDAITNLMIPDLQVTETFLDNDNIMIPSGHYTPLNTQNTSFHRDVFPCMFFIPMDRSLPLDRYGDVWMGYFMKKVVDVIGDRMTIGHPLCIHERNTHNYFEDLKLEFLGYDLSEDIIDALEGYDFSCRDYYNGYEQVIDALTKSVYRFKTQMNRCVMKKTIPSMKGWLNVCDMVM